MEVKTELDITKLTANDLLVMILMCSTELHARNLASPVENIVEKVEEKKQHQIVPNKLREPKAKKKYYYYVKKKDRVAQPKAGKGSGEKVHWTKADDTYLLENYDFVNVEECAKHLGRTIGSVKMRWFKIKDKKKYMTRKQAVIPQMVDMETD